MSDTQIYCVYYLEMYNRDVKLIPVDKLVYVYMRSHMDKDAQTFISMETLSVECEIDRRTVSKSIARLLEAQEIYLVEDKSGKRSKTYKFNKESRHFEMFSQECLDFLKRERYTTNEKCVLICLHEFSYKTQNYGELNDTLDEISKNILMPIATLKRTMKTLSDRGVIEYTRNAKNQPVRRIQWDKIMMQMIYQVQENTEDIRKIKEENKQVQNELKETRKELYELKKGFDDIVKYNEYLQAQLNHQKSTSGYKM